MLTATRLLLELTECLPRLQVGPAREERILETLIGAVGDGGVDDQHQTGLQASPQARHAVWSIDDLSCSRKEALAVLFGSCLLPGRHDGNRNGEDLGNGTGSRAEGQLDRGGRRGARFCVFVVESADDAVPVEVGEVGGGYTDQGAVHARIQALDAVALNDLGDGVPCRSIVRCVGIEERLRRTDLDLKTSLDAGRRFRLAAAAKEQ
jgi:hypothetical protein